MLSFLSAKITRDKCNYTKIIGEDTGCDRNYKENGGPGDKRFFPEIYSVSKIPRLRQSISKVRCMLQ